MHTSAIRRTKRSRRGAVLALPALAAAGALALAACGSSSASPGSNPYGGAAPGTTSGPAPVVSGTALAVGSTSLGSVLTDGRGFALYAFEADTGTTSTCSGACAAAWPPVSTTSTTPTVGTGVTQSLVGETQRSDGSMQLTYAGHPLYLFKGDSAPGNTNGQGSTAFGARWDVLTPAGQELTTKG